MKKFTLGLLAGMMIFSSLAAAVYFYYDTETSELTNETRKSLSGKFIKLKHGYVHYELNGSLDSELIVLIHGAGSGYYAWDKNYESLVNAGYRVLRYDLYGRGYSDRPSVVYDLPFFTNQLLELLDSLHIEHSFHLASVSMGAVIATDLAYRFPDKVNKLILIDPAALNTGTKHWVLKTPFLSNFFMTTYWSPRAVDKQMAEFYNPSKVPEYRIPSSNQLRFKGLKNAFVSTWLNACNVNMEKELKVIGKRKRDILLLWGDHDPLTPIKLSEKYLQLLPTATFYTIPDAGHLSNYEKPKSVNHHLILFLQSKDYSRRNSM